MNYLQKDLYSFYIYFLSIIALCIYLYGIFPLDHLSKWNYSRNDSNNEYVTKRSVDKLAIILIDSLRYDFVIQNSNHIFMPFTTTSILNNESCLVKIKTESPTVTMPRIKAITSGSTSNYIDVVLNLMTSHYEEDNFIKKAFNNGLKILFYGDDTWLKLFPNTFYRFEGTTSFFALDFTEVDDNVTKNAYKELKRNDWDIIILHYLGLDHIGHLEGPAGELAKSKLLEMDDIIKNISLHFKALENERNLKTMLLVTSDHGMKDSGGHGGVTSSEIFVPIISIGKPCKVLPGWPINFTAFQTDIASTVSAMLGLSAPVKNIGKVIPNLLYYSNQEEILIYLENSRLQFQNFEDIAHLGLDLNLLDIDFNNLLPNQTVPANIKVTVEKYYKYLNAVTEKLIKTKSNFSYLYIFIGLFLLWASLISLLYRLAKSFQKPKKPYQKFLMFGILIHGISYASTSFIEEEHQTWYFLWLTFSIMAAFESLSLQNISFKKKAFIFFSWILLCLSHRIIRKLNQTGDKWAFLPDIKSFLNSPNGQNWLNTFFFLGITFMFVSAVMNSLSFYQILSFGLSLICIVLFRINTGSIKLNDLDLDKYSRGTFEVAMFWTFFTTFFIQTIHKKHSKYLIWLLLACLLMRPHNTLLLVFQLLTSQIVNMLLRSTNDILWKNIIYIWLGNVFYYYQGNSNSLANIDIAAGFIGLNTYNPLYAGIMILAHTFNAQIFSFILSPRLILVNAILRIMPLTLYCTFMVLNLNHLFIWSVFSPKLLYEASISFLFLFLMFFSILLQQNNSYKK